MPSHAEPEKGSLAIVGLGPGRMEYITPRALKVIAGASHVLGHSSYLVPLEPLLKGKTVISSSMGKEVDRAEQAIELAKTHAVAIVSGGDAGVYGMASIVLEVLEHSGVEIPVEVVPGVTAANAAASRVGSPLSGDFAVISLSDLLTPLEVIEQRLDGILALGIPVVLYNPKSRGRPHNFALAVEHARKYLGKETPIGIVKNALREDEETIITTLGEIEEHIPAIDMHTTVIIGGKESRIWRMGDDVKGIITPRGFTGNTYIDIGADTREGLAISTKSRALARKAVGNETPEDRVKQRCSIAVGDFAMAELMRFTNDPIPAVIEALKRGAPIITDIRMVQIGIQKKGHTSEVICALDFGADIVRERGITRSSAGFIALRDRLPGSIVVIGNAPSALLSLCTMVGEGVRPAAIIGAPVGFVNAAESKEVLRTLDIPSISSEGTRGGTPVAVAAVNECITMFIEGPGDAGSGHRV